MLLPGFMHTARTFPSKNAIIDPGGSYTYERLINQAFCFRHYLSQQNISNHHPAAFYVNPGAGFITALWAAWLYGKPVLPLCLTHPPDELSYYLEDSGSDVIITDDALKEKIEPLAARLNRQLVSIDQHQRMEPVGAGDVPACNDDVPALIIYTSGTTSKPKGVILTHGNIRAHMESMIQAWEWSHHDKILCILPLHHVHGLVNVSLTALYTGATIVFHPRFDPAKVWSAFQTEDLTLFMAVPTVYYKLINYWQHASPREQRSMSKACRGFRVMVSGSAPLSTKIIDQWQNISGHTILERYGMTETGMVLSNPLKGERKPGYVGMPMPGVAVRIVDEQFREVPEGSPGELLVKGANVFRGYLNKPDETRKAFHQGWFITGDVVVVQDGYYKILGRRSVDIIKTGGYKVSAIEIEEKIRTLPGVEDCAVTSIPDEQWGEVIVAAVISREWDEAGIEVHLKQSLAHYKIPKKWIFCKKLPRNALGKVLKPEIKKWFLTGKVTI